MPNISAMKPYSILLVANYYAGGVKMECAITTRGKFADDESARDYCIKMLEYYFPIVARGNEDAHFNRRHCAIPITDYQYENLEKIETGGTGLIFVYSVE